MSNINIKRAVENIGPNTSIHTPIIEMIVNAIQAIDTSNRDDGQVCIKAIRSPQMTLDGGLPDIVGFRIEDNGIGFTDSNRNSFDTLYSDHKIDVGGKGFGRFIALRYFSNISYESTYRENGTFKKRCFTMGLDHDIIVSESVVSTSASDTGTVVTLSDKKRGSYDKRLSTIARHLVEKLLPYFLAEDYSCPDVVLCESDGTDAIRLNDFVSNQLSSVIQEIYPDERQFTILSTTHTYDFQVRLFKFYYPGNQKSRVCLVAHRREVSGSAIERYVPEFEDEFVDTRLDGDETVQQNFVIKAYVSGAYLDSNVSLERGGFEFAAEGNLIYPIGQSQIERRAAEIVRSAMGAEITSRQVMKRERVQAYVDSVAPWHKTVASSSDMRELPLRPEPEEIDGYFNRVKFEREKNIRRNVREILDDSDWRSTQDKVAAIVEQITSSSQDELTHYIATRRLILDLLAKSLELDESGLHKSEGLVHDIIFPRKGDTDITGLDDHNLWLIDERLQFTSFIASDQTLNGAHSERPDIIVFDRAVTFRGDNEESNPITIFEFKRPGRDDFANRSSKEDPVEQIMRYVIDIKDGKFKTPQGRKIRIGETTPFYGYIVCEITPKVEKWLALESDFKPMPDRQGWFRWVSGLNLYMEVLSWDKMLRDAQSRSKIFFHKLGI